MENKELKTDRATDKSEIGAFLGAINAHKDADSDSGTAKESIVFFSVLVGFLVVAPLAMMFGSAMPPLVTLGIWVGVVAIVIKSKSKGEIGVAFLGIAAALTLILFALIVIVH